MLHGQRTDVRVLNGTKTNEDKNFSTKLLSNTVIQFLVGNKSFNEAILKWNIPSLNDETILVAVYQDVLKNPDYIQYINTDEDFNLIQDQAILKSILINNLLCNELFVQHLGTLLLRVFLF